MGGETAQPESEAEISLSHEFNERSSGDMHAHSHNARARFWAWNIGFAVVFMVVGGAVALLAERLVSSPSQEVRVERFQDWRVVCLAGGRPVHPVVADLARRWRHAGFHRRQRHRAGFADVGRGAAWRAAR